MDAPRYRRVVDLAGGHQTEQRPSCLRGRAWCLLMTRVVRLVAVAIVAPAAIGVLDRGQPRSRALDLRRLRINAGGIEASEHRPGSVDVIHAPSAVPAAVLHLGSLEIGDGGREPGLVLF